MAWLTLDVLTVSLLSFVNGIHCNDADFDGGFIYPGSRVQKCPTENMSCVLTDNCTDALAESDHKQIPIICNWDVDRPLICCPSQVDDISLRMETNEFPEEDCARHATDRMLIFGGKDVSSIESYPFVASIFQSSGSVKEFLCGGSLLSKTVILTAAHCFLSMDSSSEYLVRLGSRSIQSNDNETVFQKFNVTSVKVHPGFKYPQLYNDIALIKIEGLNSYSHNIRPICLMGQADDQKSELPLTILGWGSKQFGGNISDLLQEADINVTANGECEDTMRRMGVLVISLPEGVNGNILCAGNTNNIGRDACQGDSGGPAVVLVDGVWKQRGIVSSGIGCGMKGVPGLYTRVSQYTDWIRQNA